MAPGRERVDQLVDRIDDRLLVVDQVAVGQLAIAERTPVTLTLKNGLEIRTELQSSGDPRQP